MNKTNHRPIQAMTPIMKFFALLSVLSFLGLIGLLFFSLNSTKKIAYVRSDELLSKYQGMIQAREAFKVKADAWQSQIDTLKNEFDEAVKDYEKTKSALSSRERTNKETALRKQQEDLVRYTEAINQKAEEEDQKMTQAVLDRVNNLLEVYGKKNNYDIIFGANGSGNIIYGKEAVDITNEVLLELNRNYDGS